MSVIVGGARTGIGRLLGSLKDVSAVELGATAIRGALEKSGVSASDVDYVIMGHVLQAGAGQMPARQAAIKAGIGLDVPAISINKVCLSGINAIAMADQLIRSGEADVVVAGGMESMTNAPHVLVGSREGMKYGDWALKDTMAFDGLFCAIDQLGMGEATDKYTAAEKISRERQDEFSAKSHQRAASAHAAGLFADEIVPVAIPQRKGDPKIIAKDEEYTNVFLDKIPSLRPAFDKEGTITAANASTINDGASALILASKEAVEKYGLKPIAKIVSYADAAQAPEWFTTAPSLAVPKALEKAGLSTNDIDFWELNQAFSVVGIANTKILGLQPEKVDVNGGAVALGHPLGNSGSRIIVTLIHVLKQNNGRYGGAAICNGGGGASAMIIENI